MIWNSGYLDLLRNIVGGILVGLSFGLCGPSFLCSQEREFGEALPSLPSTALALPSSESIAGNYAWDIPSAVVLAQGESLPTATVTEVVTEALASDPVLLLDSDSSNAHLDPTVTTLPSVQVNTLQPARRGRSPRARRGRMANFLERTLGRRFGHDKGIGYERVMFAPLVVDTAVGMSNVAVRLQADRGLATPDRLEYFWATPGRGPLPESRVDVLDTVLRMELGNAKLLAITEYTMRALNPERNDNTVGFGDMVVGAKGLLIDGKCTKIATVLRTYLNTGPSDRGLGTGHVSLEPGILLRHQWHETTFFHGELKYWLPIGGTPAVAGDVLKAGAGVSTIWRETDGYALMPTFEFQSYAFLAGAQTDSFGIRRRVNGDFAADIYPGLRYVLSPKNDLGLLELGVAYGATVADRDWFDNRAVFEVRLVR